MKFAAAGDTPDSCVLDFLYAQLAGACQLGMADTHQQLGSVSRYCQ